MRLTSRAAVIAKLQEGYLLEYYEGVMGVSWSLFREKLPPASCELTFYVARSVAEALVERGIVRLYRDASRKRKLYTLPELLSSDSESTPGLVTSPGPE